MTLRSAAVLLVAMTLTCAPVSQQITAAISPEGPFGLRAGMKKEALGYIVAIGESGNLFKLSKVPKPDSHFEAYAVEVSPDSGLVSAFGFSKATEPSSSEFKSIFDELSASLTIKYGAGSRRDYVSNGNALSEILWQFPPNDEKVMAVSLWTIGLPDEGSRLRLRVQYMFEGLKAWRQFDAAPVVTIPQLNLLGERYDRKAVKLRKVVFSGADNLWVEQLPGVAIADNGLVTTVDVTESQKWIGFSVRDGDYESFTRCYASKAVYGELLAAMKRGTKLTLYGYVVRLRQAGWYGLVADQIIVD
jgi:hypothetical protein